MPLNVKQLTLQSSLLSSVFRFSCVILLGVLFLSSRSILFDLRIYGFVAKIGKQTHRNAVVFLKRLTAEQSFRFTSIV